MYDSSALCRSAFTLERCEAIEDGPLGRVEFGQGRRGRARLFSIRALHGRRPPVPPSSVFAGFRSAGWGIVPIDPDLVELIDWTRCSPLIWIMASLSESVDRGAELEPTGNLGLCEAGPV